MCILFIGNILCNYSSKDLRHFFSEYTECKAFLCFHYRHRQINLDLKNKLNLLDNKILNNDFEINEKLLCTFCEIKKKFLEKFIKKYNNTYWYDYNNNTSDIKVKIIKIDKNRELNDKIKNFIEFCPPVRILPQGNIGTPLEFFIKEINNCRMPVYVLKKLGIIDSIMANKTLNEYGKVSLDYRNIFGEFSLSQENTNNLVSLSNYITTNVLKSYEEDVEEWDRYESLHNDVTEQDRTKPRLYEDNMEIVWEKGGSGLVYYTDDFTWKGLEGKFDFDEDAADDWDVDTDIYTNYNPDALKDTPEGQLLKLKLMKSLKNNKKIENLQHPVKFHISKFAVNQMKKFGWKKGESLGKYNSGLKKPLEAHFRHPKNRSGIGNIDKIDENNIDSVSLNNYLILKKLNKPKKHFIFTKFDKINNDVKSHIKGKHGSTPWRSQSPNYVKYLDKTKKL